MLAGNVEWSTGIGGITEIVEIFSNTLRLRQDHNSSCCQHAVGNTLQRRFRIMVLIVLA